MFGANRVSFLHSRNPRREGPTTNPEKARRPSSLYAFCCQPPFIIMTAIVQPPGKKLRRLSYRWPFASQEDFDDNLEAE